MNLNQKTKDILSFFLRVGLSAALLFYLYKKIDVTKTWEIVKTADLGYILYAGFIFFVINLILLGRWLMMIKAFDIKVPLITVVRYFCIGVFGNLFLPSSIGGDFIKTIGLCMYCKEKAKVVASVLLDRLSGFGGMVVVATISFASANKLISDSSVLITIVMMAVVSSLMVTILFNEKIYSFCCQIFSRFPKIKASVMQMHYDIALLKGNRAVLYRMVGISCVAQLMAAVLSYYLGKALHQDIDLIYFIIFTPIICVAASMPSIGGLGVREAGAAYLLAKVGVSSGIAVSISLMTFVFMVIFGLIGGIVFVTTKSFEPVRSKRA